MLKKRFVEMVKGIDFIAVGIAVLVNNPLGN